MIAGPTCCTHTLHCRLKKTINMTSANRSDSGTNRRAPCGIWEVSASHSQSLHDRLSALERQSFHLGDDRDADRAFGWVAACLDVNLLLRRAKTDHGADHVWWVVLHQKRDDLGSIGGDQIVALQHKKKGLSAMLRKVAL